MRRNNKWFYFSYNKALKLSKKKKINHFFQHPITQHVALLLKFFLFNVLLPGMDISTDVRTAESYFLRGHFYWGFCTLLFVFLPFLGKFLILILNIVKCFVRKLDTLEKYPNKITKFKVLCRRSPELIWHFPPLIILRSVFTIQIKYQNSISILFN